MCFNLFPFPFDLWFHFLALPSHTAALTPLSSLSESVLSCSSQLAVPYLPVDFTSQFLCQPFFQSGSVSSIFIPLLCHSYKNLPTKMCHFHLPERWNKTSRSALPVGLKVCIYELYKALMRHINLPEEMHLWKLRAPIQKELQLWGQRPKLNK